MTQQADWAQQLWLKQGIPEGWDLPCPMCDYNLRGITEPRCPECGFRFTWEELLDPTRRQHPYLYEHRTLDPSKAFWRTLANGLLPWHFWKTLHPAQPSNPRRLRHYFLWCMLPLVFAIATILLAQIAADYEAMETQRNAAIAAASNPALQKDVLKYYSSVQAYIDAVEASSPRLLSWYYLIGPGGATVRQIVFWLFLPLLQFATLMIFQESMSNARVKKIHVWRCLVYSWDCALFVGVILAIAAILQMTGDPIFARRWPGLGTRGNLHDLLAVTVLLQWAMLALLFVSGIRLAFAYRFYLRFDHPELTITSVQVILFLLLPVLAVLGAI